MSKETMPAGVVVVPGTFAVQDRPVITEVPDGWVLIDICAVGLCGTDYHILEGKHPFFEYPRVIGHELSGRVVEGNDNWSAGDLSLIHI